VLERLRTAIDPVGLGVLAGALLLFVPLCGAYGLWDPWETHYAEAARQILERGDWWTLYWEEDYFFSKPILLFWLMAGSFSVFGVNEFAARLPIALCAAAGVIAVYWGMAAASRSKLTGVLAALAVATTPYYAFIARQCITDMPFVASMTIALMALVRFEMGAGPRRARHIYMFYFFCGLATLAKGPLGLLLPGAVVLAYLFMSGDWGFLRRARIPTGALVFLVVAAPWYVVMLALHGERFYNEFIVYNNVQRATGSGVHGARLDLFYYLRRADPAEPSSGGPWLQTGMWPWLGFLPAALFTYVGRRFGALGAKLRKAGPPLSKEEGARLRLAMLLVAWAAITFIVFSTIPTKFNHYLLPMAPAVAMVAALWIGDVAARRIAEPVGTVGLLVAAGLVAWITGILGREPWDLLNLFLYHYGRSDLEQFEVGTVYQVLGYGIAGTLVVASLVRKYRLHSAFVAGIFALCLTIYGIDHYLVEASDCVSQRDAFEHYYAERRPGDQLIVWQMNYRGEIFYGRSRSVKATSSSHLRWLLSRTKRSFMVGNHRVYPALTRAHRRVTGRDPRVLNPATCSTRMVLCEGPTVRAPDFRPRDGDTVDEVPAAARLEETPRFGEDLTLVGREVRWLGSGSDLTADVTLYLRCERDTEEWWKIFLHGESLDLPGRRAISDHTAVSDLYPSVAWRRGDIVVDRTRLRMGWILETMGGEGELQVSMGLFHDLTRARVLPESVHDGENRVVLARYDSTETPDDLVLDEIPAGVRPLETPVRLGEVATVVATKARLRGQGRRAVAEVTLYLRADTRTDHPWRVFVHAVRGTNREVSDHQPASGRARTTRWEPGRIYVDRTLLDIGRMGSGTIEIHAGMFDRHGRAEVRPGDADVGDSRVGIAELELD